MCGIAGIYDPKGRPPSIEQLVHMAGALAHRGPDEFGVYRDSRVGLAHARLSIIDLASGQQPLANEDNTLYVVFNGEIFNYVELRAELIELGHSFRTKSDTEVIVHAYEAWGNRAFARFNGQYAIALWDRRERKFVLARDRVGVRPLYVCEHGGRVYFASEVKAIFAADAQLPRRLDPIGVEETFTFWSVVPPQSVFAGIQELRPGHVRTYRDGAAVEEAFYAPRYPANGHPAAVHPAALHPAALSPADFSAPEQAELPAFSGTLEDAVVAVRSALERATSLRMLRADVPVGSYLSGGLDSSLVAALGLRAKGEKFRTFSLRFEDAEYDETSFQRTMSEFVASNHAEVVVSREDIAAAFPRVIAHTERPILRTAPAPMFLLSELVRREGVKVVLTGEGADEMFAGYDLFREAKVRRFWARAPHSTSRPRLLERLYPYLARSPVSQRAMARAFFGRGLERFREPGFSHTPRWHSAIALQRLFSAEQREASRGADVVGRLIASLPAEFSSWTTLAQDQYLEVRTLLTGYILSSQGDRMLMAHSVEGRFPFLDAEVMELANSLPPAYKLRVLDEKHVLKRASRGLVPASILARKKQPYRAPDALSFTGPRSPEWVREALSESSVRAAGIFDTRAVGQLWNKCQSRTGEDQFSNADNMALVGILSTQLLHDQLVVKNAFAGRTVPLTTKIDHLLE